MLQLRSSGNGGCGSLRSFDPQFPLHFTLRTPTQDLFFSVHKNWVTDCGCKIALTNREILEKNLQLDSTVVVFGGEGAISNSRSCAKSNSKKDVDVEIAGGEGVVSSSRSCPDSHHFFHSLPTTLQHPLFLEFGILLAGLGLR